MHRSPLKQHRWRCANFAGNMEVDGQFVLEDGLQVMSGATGYTSWLSLPHFLYASPAVRSRFGVSPSVSLHLPFVSGRGYV